MRAEELIDPEFAQGASLIALADFPDVEDRIHDGIQGLFTDQDAVRTGFGQILQAEFLHGDVADILRSAFTAHGRTADVVILDPPRDGCGEGVLTGVAALHPERIVYISCNPATQARDVRLLAGCGYGLSLLQPLDMFPQTGHIEVIALLTRNHGSEG